MHLASKLRAAAIAAVVVASPLALHALLQHQPVTRHLGSHRIAEEPSMWWYEQRSFPSGTIPTQEYQAAVQQAMRDRAQAQLSTSAGLLSWQFIGPDNIGGRITAIAADSSGTTVYFAAANGGVFKSGDGGNTWTPIFDSFNAYSVGALALDPHNPNILYVGTGESNPAIDTYDGNGVYRTTDGGASWTWLGLGNVKRINRIVIDPNNTQHILLAGAGSIFTLNNDHGIWRSMDGGQTWQHTLFVDNVTYGADIAMNPVHPESLFCSMWDFGPSPTSESAIYASRDTGGTWTRLGPAQGLPASNDSTDRIALAYAKSKPSTIYAQIMYGAISGNSYQLRGIYRTTDGGATWVKRDVTMPANTYGGFGWYFGTMGVDPTNADKVYGLGVDLLRSTDGGVNWGSILGTMHVDQHAIWINPTNPNRIFMGNDGGFYRTTSGGSPWGHPAGQPISQFYAIAVDASNPARTMGGTQDNNSIIGTGSPSGWTAVIGGDGFYCLFDHTVSTTVFGEFQNMSSGQGPLRSTSNGIANTFGAPSGFNSGDRYNWNAPFAMDPTDHNVLLAGSHRIYKSTDNGVTYTPVSGDLAFNGSSSRPSGTLSTIGMSPLSHLIYYTGSSNGKVYRSTDGGVNWVDKTAGLPLRYVTRVTPDVFDSMTVYCSLSGFNGDPEVPVHLYKSTNQGDTWTNISGNLPDVPVNDIVVDNLNAMRLYVGTDLGVYTTQNGGSTWYPLGQGLPFQAVFDLALHPGARTLYAGTHGRSMWKLDLTQMPAAVGESRGPAAIALSSPWPNPSRGAVSFTLDLPTGALAQIGVFDAAGRRVRELQTGALAAGRHSFHWDGRDSGGRPVAAGVYFVRAQVPGGVRSQRVIRAS